MSILEYNDKVFTYLEMLEYPQLIVEFNPKDVAKSISTVIIQCYVTGLSFRLCALLIFGLTMTYQVIPKTKEMRTH